LLGVAINVFKFYLFDFLNESRLILVNGLIGSAGFSILIYFEDFYYSLFLVSSLKKPSPIVFTSFCGFVNFGIGSGSFLFFYCKPSERDA